MRRSLDTGKQGIGPFQNSKNDEVKHKKCFNVTLMSFNVTLISFLDQLTSTKILLHSRGA